MVLQRAIAAALLAISSSLTFDSAVHAKALSNLTCGHEWVRPNDYSQRILSRGRRHAQSALNAFYHVVEGMLKVQL